MKKNVLAIAILLFTVIRCSTAPSSIKTRPKHKITKTQYEIAERVERASSKSPSGSSKSPSVSSQYLVMEAGTNYCADGYAQLTSAAKCEMYADNTDGLTYEYSGSWTDSPKG